MNTQPLAIFAEKKGRKRKNNKEPLSIFVDSSYDWRKTRNYTGEGTICVLIPEKKFLYTAPLTIYFPGLKQLNNRFELVAIQKGIDFSKKYRRKDFVVFSDSQIAVGWAKHPKVRWIPREANLAGIYLDTGKLPE